MTTRLTTSGRRLSNPSCSWKLPRVGHKVGPFYIKKEIRNIFPDGQEAEEALTQGSQLAADFRFGHDTGLLPLVATMGIKGMDKKLSAYHAHEYWSSSEFIPMASNLQMVFYKNKKGDILVKLLYNEKETAIPAIKPDLGPYYDWSALRQYLLAL